MTGLSGNSRFHIKMCKTAESQYFISSCMLVLTFTQIIQSSERTHQLSLPQRYILLGLNYILGGKKSIICQCYIKIHVVPYIENTFLQQYQAKFFFPNILLKYLSGIFCLIHHSHDHYYINDLCHLFYLPSPHRP